MYTIATRGGIMAFLAAAALFVATPPTPVYAQVDNLRQDAQQDNGETIDGTIYTVGNGTLELRDDGGNIYEVRFFAGTVKIPHSLILRPGTKVSVSGYDLGNVFSAKQIKATY